MAAITSEAVIHRLVAGLRDYLSLGSEAKDSDRWWLYWKSRDFSTVAEMTARTQLLLSTLQLTDDVREQFTSLLVEIGKVCSINFHLCYMEARPAQYTVLQRQNMMEGWHDDQDGAFEAKARDNTMRLAKDKSILRGTYAHSGPAPGPVRVAPAPVVVVQHRGGGPGRGGGWVRGSRTAPAGQQQANRGRG